MDRTNLIFEGREKLIYSTDEPGVVRIYYKDDATAFGGIKRAVIKGKGAYNARIAAIVFSTLEEAGIKTHFIKSVSDREHLCRKISIVPIQVIVRNRLAGSTARMLGVANGTKIPNTVYELRYNDDELCDPMINEHHAVALGLVSYEEMEEMMAVAARVNQVLKALFSKAGIELVDFKMEFGRSLEGELIVSDEISPDNARLWDEETGEILDKDRFRHDLSDVCASYKNVMDRLLKI
ncbi:MAG: phosphoribosylaminoimidazolesuccinocarboxamide synthase [Bacteroidales bacterium]|nr:phosphoribosylaminoimidazolesuccinocarboxamide synthase [Bacteroidales bacterium]